MKHHNGFVLLMVLSTLFILGFVMLENARYVTDAIRWQAQLQIKRVYLDWQLESAIHCTALHLTSLQLSESAECLIEQNLQITIEQQPQVNQIKLQVQADTASHWSSTAIANNGSYKSIATSTIMQLGKQENNAAIISNQPLPSAVLGSSITIVPSALMTFYDYADSEQLRLRWGSELLLSEASMCGSELLAQVQQSYTDIVITGSCSISDYYWDQLAVASQSTALNLLFVGPDIELSGSNTLYGIVAVWQKQGTLTIGGNLRIEGGLLLQTPTMMEVKQGGVSVMENSQYLMASRFKFAKRSWLQGSWRDF
ncbi:hypothetical protein [Vibrio rarus]|uniref:hypothetical protein n=1 Tax=Vibrio rarus TaxID=413403 RepID=UPI0021C3B927|nr:hypothetical protein [Vibrio rarus]